LWCRVVVLRDDLSKKEEKEKGVTNRLLCYSSLQLCNNNKKAAASVCAYTKKKQIRLVKWLTNVRTSIEQTVLHKREKKISYYHNITEAYFTSIKNGEKRKTFNVSR
jgi:hypothetical protein